MSSCPEVIRTLAAILMADVADYGQLMGDDDPTRHHSAPRGLRHRPWLQDYPSPMS